MTINGYSNRDLTAAEHSSSSDPWFHFYWPLPGELPFISWWPYDDRNNPNMYPEANLPGGVQRTGGLTGVAGLVQTNPNPHPLDAASGGTFTPAPAANVPAQPATGAPGAGPTTNTVPPATTSPTNIPGSSTPTQVTTQSEPTTAGGGAGPVAHALNWKGVALAILVLWLLRRS